MFIKNRGQALIETIILGAVLIIFSLGVTFLGKLMSLKESLIASSRTVAFECSIYVCSNKKNRVFIEERIKDHHFKKIDFSRKNRDDSSRKKIFHEVENSLWKNRKGTSFIKRLDEIYINIKSMSFDAGRNVALGMTAVSSPTNLIGAFAGPQKFSLDIKGGLFLATVHVPLSKNIFLEEGLEIGRINNLHEKIGILTDTWSASGTYGLQGDSVEARVQKGSQLNSLVQQGIQSAYKPVLSEIFFMSSIGLEPSAKGFTPYKIDVGIVPKDRLQK